MGALPFLGAEIPSTRRSDVSAVDVRPVGRMGVRQGCPVRRLPQAAGSVPLPTARLVEAGLGTWKPLCVSTSIPRASSGPVRGTAGRDSRTVSANPPSNGAIAAPGARPDDPRPPSAAARSTGQRRERSDLVGNRTSRRRPGSGPVGERTRQKRIDVTGVDIHGRGDAPWERSHTASSFCPPPHAPPFAPHRPPPSSPSASLRRPVTVGVSLPKAPDSCTW